MEIYIYKLCEISLSNEQLIHIGIIRKTQTSYCSFKLHSVRN